jgi:hypothetical protein
MCARRAAFDHPIRKLQVIDDNLGDDLALQFCERAQSAANLEIQRKGYVERHGLRDLVGPAGHERHWRTQQERESISQRRQRFSRPLSPLRDLVYGCPNLQKRQFSVALHYNNCCNALPLSEALSFPDTRPLVPGLSRFDDVWPAAGLMLAAVVNVAWIATLGYGLIRLVF